MKEKISILTITTIVLFLLPAIVVTIKGLWKDKFLYLFGIYGILAAAINFLDLFKIPYVYIESLNVVYNMFDIPFVIYILYQITRNELARKMMKWSMIFYGVWQIFSLFQYGLKYNSMKYTLGFGIVLIIIFTSYLLTTYVRRMELTKIYIAHMILLGSLLFNYGSFIIIYIFDYYVADYNADDNLFLYYISSSISMLMVTGALFVPAKFKVPAKA
ncbi:MAG: hypothetical protein ACXWV5_06225 [Flavitalea sp.]